MPTTHAGVLVCGAGIAGVSAAYHLAVRRGLADVWLVDERPPLSLTSDKSSECYRNWWPGPGDAMVGLMNRSIDLLEELARATGNVFQLNRRGYLYVTANRGARRRSGMGRRGGRGPRGRSLRIHGWPAGAAYEPAPPTGFEGQPTGADLIVDPALIRRHFPYLAEETAAVLHVRRAGWLSGQQLGMYLLEQARAHGVRLVRARLAGVDVQGGRVAGAVLDDGTASFTVATPHLVDAAGPFCAEVAGLLGINLPIFAELHAKVSFHDRLAAVPRRGAAVDLARSAAAGLGRRRGRSLGCSARDRLAARRAPRGRALPARRRGGRRRAPSCCGPTTPGPSR